MRFKDLHPNIKTRLYVSFFQRVSQSMVFPFMAIYFADHFGATAAGFMMLVTVIGGLISSFYGGYYADVKGRKPVLLVSESIRFASLLLLAAANSPWLLLPIATFFLFLLNVILIGISTPANEALLIDVSTPETRKYVFTLSYWVTNLSLAIGTLVGAFFYKSHFFELLLFTAFSSLLSYLLIRKFVVETIPIQVQAEKVSLAVIVRNYVPVFQDKRFLRYFAVGVLMLGIEMQLSYYISVRLAQQFQTQVLPLLGELDGVQMFGIIRTENTLLVVLLVSLVSRFSKRLSDQLTFQIGTVLFAGGYMVLAVSNDAWMLLWATFVFTIGELLYVPVFQALFVDIPPEDSRSKYIAVNKLNVRVAMMMGSLGISLGVVLPPWGMAVIYGIMGLASIYLFVGLMSVVEKEKQVGRAI